jgi:hypothetical protein
MGKRAELWRGAGAANICLQVIDTVLSRCNIGAGVNADGSEPLCVVVWQNSDLSVQPPQASVLRPSAFFRREHNPALPRR